MMGGVPLRRFSGVATDAGGGTGNAVIGRDAGRKRGDESTLSSGEILLAELSEIDVQIFDLPRIVANVGPSSSTAPVQVSPAFGTCSRTRNFPLFVAAPSKRGLAFSGSSPDRWGHR